MGLSLTGKGRAGFLWGESIMGLSLNGEGRAGVLWGKGAGG